MKWRGAKAIRGDERSDDRINHRHGNSPPLPSGEQQEHEEHRHLRLDHCETKTNTGRQLPLMFSEVRSGDNQRRDDCGIVAPAEHVSVRRNRGANGDRETTRRPIANAATCSKGPGCDNGESNNIQRQEINSFLVEPNWRYEQVLCEERPGWVTTGDIVVRRSSWRISGLSITS